MAEMDDEMVDFHIERIESTINGSYENETYAMGAMEQQLKSVRNFLQDAKEE